MANVEDYKLVKFAHYTDSELIKFAHIYATDDLAIELVYRFSRCREPDVSSSINLLNENEALRKQLQSAEERCVDLEDSLLTCTDLMDGTRWDKVHRDTD